MKNIKTLKEYIEDLQDIISENPEAIDFPVIYSIDDEGNDYYHKVIYNPSLFYVGDLDDYYLEDVISEDNLEEDGDDNTKLNAICIN